jgi:hypothetical protein
MIVTEKEKLQQAIDNVNKFGSITEAAKTLGIPRKTLSGRYNKALDLGYVADVPIIDAENEVAIESKIKKINQENRELKNKYNGVLKLLDAQKNQNSIIEEFSSINFEKYDKILVKKDTSKSESSAVILCSDLHYEDIIDPKKVDNLNEYNPEIASRRFYKLFQNALNLVEINRHGTNIKQCILFLGGDFINGYIHEEMIENNAMSPIEACIDVFKLFISAIDFLIENGKFEKIIVPCSIGNHGRNTQKMRISTAAENSYEYLLYSFLANHYEKSGIVEFKLSKGYHNYLDVYGYLLRFHHGQAVRYQGGVNGVSVPVNKAIAQWNQARTAYLDIIAHWHSLMSSKQFIINGSIVGYSPYSISIKATFEKPQQFMFLMHSKYGRTIQCPIFVD